ncbi:MAG: hypothetical protein WD317_03905 [Balneolaceae bacterium]
MIWNSASMSGFKTHPWVTSGMTDRITRSFHTGIESIAETEPVPGIAGKTDSSAVRQAKLLREHGQRPQIIRNYGGRRLLS